MTARGLRDRARSPADRRRPKPEGEPAATRAAPLPAGPGWLEWPRDLPSARPRADPPRGAGGIIVDVHEGIARIAVIARRNRAGRVEWCLPKGHMENGETLAEAAAREVAEETGIEGRVLTELGTIDYWFATGEKRVHKYVHHYLLEATGGYLTIENDPDQEAIDVAWLPLAEAHQHLTFPNERRIARQAWQRLSGSE